MEKTEQDRINFCDDCKNLMQKRNGDCWCVMFHRERRFYDRVCTSFEEKEDED